MMPEPVAVFQSTATTSFTATCFAGHVLLDHDHDYYLVGVFAQVGPSPTRTSSNKRNTGSPGIMLWKRGLWRQTDDAVGNRCRRLEFYRSSTLFKPSRNLSMDPHASIPRSLFVGHDCL